MLFICWEGWEITGKFLAAPETRVCNVVQSACCMNRPDRSPSFRSRSRHTWRSLGWPHAFPLWGTCSCTSRCWGLARRRVGGWREEPHPRSVFPTWRWREMLLSTTKITHPATVPNSPISRSSLPGRQMGMMLSAKVTLLPVRTRARSFS